MNGMFERRADKRRADRGSRKAFDPVKLSERQHEILDMAVLGVKGSVIASTLGVCEETVSNAINSTLGRQKMAMIRGARDAETVDVAKRIKELIPMALDIYEKILSEEATPGNQPHGGASINLQKATADVLMKEFSGHVVPKKVLVGTAKVTPELIRELKEQGKAAAQECGLVIEAEAEVLDVL